MQHLQTFSIDSVSKLHAFLFTFSPFLIKFLDDSDLYTLIPSKSINYMLEFTNEIINKRKNRIEVYTCFLEFLIHYLY